MAVADISAHTFTVIIDEQVVREMAALLGKPGFDTPVGAFRVLEKQRNVVFDSRTIGIPLDSPEGYLIDGEYAVGVTWGGVYVHSAPWSVGFARLHERQMRLYQPQPRECRLVLRHGSYW